MSITSVTGNTTELSFTFVHNIRRLHIEYFFNDVLKGQNTGHISGHIEVSYFNSFMYSYNFPGCISNLFMFLFNSFPHLYHGVVLLSVYVQSL